MKIPRKLKIDSHRITVRKAKAIRNVGEGDDKGKKYLGLCDLNHGIILLSTHFGGVKLPRHKRESTFFHEILHYVSSQRGIKLKENQVQSLAYGLIAVIRDNGLDFRRGKK